MAALLAADGGGSLGWPIVSAVVIYVLNQQITTYVRKRRLKTALLVDCIETLERLADAYPGFECERQPDLSSADDLEAATKHFNGFVVVGPMPETRELIALLRPREARLIVQYFERWELFRGLEQRYSATYQRLVETAAKCCQEGADVERRLREEYWQQLRVSLTEMQTTARELCLFSCKIFLALAPQNELALGENSNRRWKSWKDFQEEKRKYDC